MLTKLIKESLKFKTEDVEKGRTQVFMERNLNFQKAVIKTIWMTERRDSEDMQWVRTGVGDMSEWEEAATYPTCHPGT